MAKKQREFLKVGDIIWGYCSHCMARQEKIWDGNKLICTGCHPEYKIEENKKEKLK